MKKSKQVREKPDCPNLNSIQRKEQTLIKMRQEIRERERETFKIREGIPRFKWKPPINGEGCSLENGTLCKPILDMEVKKRAKKREV